MTKVVQNIQQYKVTLKLLDVKGYQMHSLCRLS